MTPHSRACALARNDQRARDLGALFRRCSAGNAEAREAIIVLFLPLARRLARGYQGRGEPLDDLIQAASVGLIKAVDRYAPERGSAFPAYARPVIVGEIQRHFRDTTWRVHVPRQVRDRAALVLRAEQELTAVSGPATPEAIARYLGVCPEQVAEARCALQADSPQSLDANRMITDGDALPLREVIGAEDLGYERVELSVGVRQALLTLKPRDQKVLLLRLAWELSQAEIAGRVGLSQMHVCRILRNAGVALSRSCGLARTARRIPRRWSPPTIAVIAPA